MTNSTGRVQARRVRLPGTILPSRPQQPVHEQTGTERNRPATTGRTLRSAPIGAHADTTVRDDALPADAA